MTNVEIFCARLEEKAKKYQHEPEGPALRNIVSGLKQAIQMDKDIDLKAIDKEIGEKL